MKFSMMGRKRGRFFSSAPFSAPLCACVGMAWPSIRGTVLQASCLTACQFGIAVLKTVLVFWPRYCRPATVCEQ